MSKAKAKPVGGEVCSCGSQNQPVNVEPVRHICPVKSFQLGDKPRRCLWGAGSQQEVQNKRIRHFLEKKERHFVFLPLSLMSD